MQLRRNQSMCVAERQNTAFDAHSDEAQRRMGTMYHEKSHQWKSVWMNPFALIVFIDSFLSFFFFGLSISYSFSAGYWFCLRVHYTMTFTMWYTRSGWKINWISRLIDRIESTQNEIIRHSNDRVDKMNANVLIDRLNKMHVISFDVKSTSWPEHLQWLVDERNHIQK